MARQGVIRVNVQEAFVELLKISLNWDVRNRVFMMPSGTLRDSS
jgi:hypothetical protein